MSIPDFTVVVALDAEHLEEFRVSFPTWARHKPDLLQRPWLFLCHDTVDCKASWWLAHLESIIERRIASPMAHMLTFHGQHQFTQRHRMLSAFVCGLQPLKTPYYLKLDTDCIATGSPDWIDPAWFVDQPAIIAPAWGYSKPPAMLDDFNRWAESKIEFAGTVRQPFRLSEDGSKAFHPRIISYCMFGRTDFTRRIAELAGGEVLPIPSQDTFLHQCAYRLGEPILRTRMPGWRHVGRGGDRLKQAAAEALQGAV